MDFVVVYAYILDLILGDPRWFPHPVKIMGWIIQKLEPPVRKIIRNQRLAGTVFACVITSLIWFVSFLVIQKTVEFNKYAGMFLSVLLIYTTISIKDLKDETMLVYHALKRRNINEARKNLSMIVGRDTLNLSEKEIIRATVETIAENTVDGIISPLFYAFLGGAPLSLTYKAVNTMDSMVGNKNERYKDFGWFGAKIDDLLNFIPARLSVLVVPLACWLGLATLSGRSGLNSIKIILRDGKKNPSPNSGISEAGFAGAMGVQLGGINSYNSVPTIKPLIGNNSNPLEIKHIKNALKIAYLTSLLCIISGIVIIYIIRRN